METQGKKFTVGVLQEQDLYWFTEVAAFNMFVDELKRPELVDLERMYEITNNMLSGGTAWVVKCDGENVGAIGALLTPNLFNPRITTLVELFWYVLPEYRNTRAGVLLLKAFEEKGEECADESTLSLLPSSEVNIKSLEKREFLLGEFAFRKEHRRT